MKLFGGDTISGLMTRFNMPEDIPLQHPLVSRAIEQAQVKVEGYNFDIRKHLVEYDDVINKQREIIYSRRKTILEGDDKSDDLKKEILDKIHNSISSLVLMNAENFGKEKSPSEQITQEFATIIPFDQNSVTQISTQLEQIKNTEEKINFLTNLTDEVYQKREKDFGEDVARQVEKFVSLSVIDNLWVDHLDAIDNLRQGIGLRGYGQKDPLVEYKNEAFKMFEQLISSIDDEVVHRIYKIHVHQNQPPPTENPLNRSGVSESAAGSNIVQETSSNTEKLSGAKSAPGGKLGRNDPCWCGSGKKYKKCHYPN